MTSSPATDRPSRREVRHAATKDEIVAASWQLSREVGLAGWTMRDVGDAVGMRAPSLYVYLAGKNALYDAMYAEGYRRLVADVLDAATGRDPRRTLRQGARLFVQFCVSDPARFQLLFLRTLPGFEPSAESYRLAQAALARIAGVLRENGITSARDIDLWTAVLTGIASQQISNDPGGTRWTRLLPAAVDRLLPARPGTA